MADSEQHTDPLPSVISMDNITNDGHQNPVSDQQQAAVIDAGPMNNVYQPGVGTNADGNTWTTSDTKYLVDETGKRPVTRADVEEAERRLTKRNHIIIGVSTAVMAVVFTLTIVLAIKYA